MNTSFKVKSRQKSIPGKEKTTGNEVREKVQECCVRGEKHPVRFTRYVMLGNRRDSGLC